MQDLWKLLSSPRHLIIFEAAARHKSFTQASGELNVQQPAVSAAIKQLEATLGVLLFNRSHRKVELTDAGQRLFIDVSRALNDIRVSVQAIHQRGKNNHVTLSASSAFTYYWIMPKLNLLREAYPEIDLRLQSSDREPDIDTEGISLAIRHDNGNWPGCDAALIAPEVIYPVASPHVMNAAVNLNEVPDLIHQRLIHLEEPIRERPTWAQWFAHFGITDHEPTAGLRLNDYALVLQAAIAGEGFSFGWHHLTEPLISQGLLAARQEWRWETGRGFYLVWSKNVPLLPQAKCVRDWLVSLASKSDDTA